MEEREESCGKCRFWLQNKGEFISGICRRYPPNVQWDERLEEAITLFPEMDDDGWCGEWQPTRITGFIKQKNHFPWAFEDHWLSVRVVRIFEFHEINSIEELTQLSADDLLGLRNFGKTCLTEVREWLGKQGLKLRGD